jgi:hypothetical protein
MDIQYSGEEATEDPVIGGTYLYSFTRISAKYIPRTRHARVAMRLVLVRRTQVAESLPDLDGSNGYNSHLLVQVPKERQITTKDRSYDIDPGKSPTKASSR